jgi:tetratricopeptide (TPR) repeat protein
VHAGRRSVRFGSSNRVLIGPEAGRQPPAAASADAAELRERGKTTLPQGFLEALGDLHWPRTASRRPVPALDVPDPALLIAAIIWYFERMTMRFSATMISVVLLVAIATPAFAANQLDWDECTQTGDRDRSIAGCTRVIQRGDETAQIRALAYNNRGVAYALGDPDRAIADYTEAIRLDPGLALAYNNPNGIFTGFSGSWRQRRRGAKEPIQQCCDKSADARRAIPFP